MLASGCGSGDEDEEVTGSSTPGITAGGYHTCAVYKTEVFKCWGRTNHGQVGNAIISDDAPVLAPTEISGIPAGISALALGEYHSCILLVDGIVQCWGLNDEGQLGDGGTSDQARPVDVQSLSDVSALAAGSSHTCALVSGGVKCWGGNSRGQLGDGTTDSRSSPTNVSDLSSGVTSISAGYDHTCARLDSGAVKCWGANTSGQLGDGTQGTDRLTPVSVSGISSGTTFISVGRGHTCAVVSGAAKCWGDNYYGQLGNGESGSGQSSPIPVSVSDLTSGVASIVAGGGHTCGILDSGALKCWGNNFDGQVGDGTVAGAHTTATDVIDLSTGVSSVTLGSDHTCVMVSDQTFRCWGLNLYGQIGNSTVADSSQPQEVPF